LSNTSLVLDVDMITFFIILVIFFLLALLLNIFDWIPALTSITLKVLGIFIVLYLIVAGIFILIE